MLGEAVDVNGEGAGSLTPSRNGPRDGSLLVRVEGEDESGNAAPVAVVVLTFPAAEGSTLYWALHAVLLSLHAPFRARGGSALGYISMSLVDGSAVAAGILTLV